MAKENAFFNELDEVGDGSFDFDELEEKLQSQLEAELSELDFLESEKEKIGNPDALGKVILDEVWKQFGNQIGLDMTNETLIQKYDREHPETYSEVSKTVMQDQKYKDAAKAMKEQQKAGDLKDGYTGKDIKANDSANMDHVESRKDIYDNKRRRQANLSTEALANKDENLRPTNESLNKSKGAKSVDEYLKEREKREQGLKEQNEKANKKVDASNMSDLEKRLQKEKNNKRLQDKLDADDKLMKNADDAARKAINKDITVGVVKEVGKKAGKDALKTMAISALFSLSKEILNGLVRFLKSQAKSFKLFLDEMKESIKAFFSKIVNVLQAGGSSVLGTILSEIFGPIVSVFKKLASLIKQGVSSVVDAIKYLSSKEHKNEPFSIKVAQVGKIITTGLIAGGAIFLGEVLEKVLLTIPGMQIELPLIGTLANMIGLFLASMVSGLIGAIIINLIDKFIAKRQKAEFLPAQIDKGNEILATQSQLLLLNKSQLNRTKEKAASSIVDRHTEAAAVINESLSAIFSEDTATGHDKDFGEMERILKHLQD